MDVEDHPIYPRWKSALEVLIETRNRLDLADGPAERRICAIALGKALDACFQITDEVSSQRREWLGR